MMEWHRMRPCYSRTAMLFFSVGPQLTLSREVSIFINNWVNLMGIIWQWSEGKALRERKEAQDRNRGRRRQGGGISIQDCLFHCRFLLQCSSRGESRTVVNGRLSSSQPCESFDKRHPNVKPEGKLLMGMTWIMVLTLSQSLTRGMEYHIGWHLHYLTFL